MDLNDTVAEFRLSRWTIRIKLQFIISGIIFVSLLGMILTASYFFRKDSELRVQENGLKLNEVIALNIRNSVNAIGQTVRISAETLERKAATRDLLERTIFGDDTDLIYLGVYARDGGGLRATTRLVSPDFLREFELSAGDLAALTPKYRADFIKSFNDSIVLVNASPGFSTPLVGISFPYKNNEVLITYLRMNFFLEAFQASGITETFMVNDDGTVVAHSDQNIVVSGTRLADSPIVQNMRTNPVNNGLMRYQDEEGEWHLGSFRKLPFGGLGIVSTVSEDKAFAEVNNIQRRNLYLMIVVVALAVLIVFFFARGLTQPVLKLVTAARMIRDGSYGVDLQPESQDEIGLLTDSFNSMSHGLKERENLKVSFGKFVDKELTEMALGGERKEVAVFFSDIRGFTAMSEKLRPEEVVEFLNGYFTRMVRCVNETNGRVDKYIGDALMAVWGAFRPHGNEAENAVNAALRMRDELIDFNRGRGTARKPLIHMGAGINLGQVVAGQIGSDEKLEYTVIGDTVNLASRTEMLTKHFGVDILITNNVLDRVKGQYRVAKMDEMKVKGKAKPITVFAVLSRTDDPNGPSNLEELREYVGIDYDPGKTAAAGAKYESVK
ncbi:MAG: HAMP domain-containing protein [bacterium]|nr:HAMP domain-containing protein [bacterium]